MKKTIFTVATMAVFMCGGGYVAGARDVVGEEPVMSGGVGPVVTGSMAQSQLPSKAQKFIDRMGGTVVKCERKYMQGEYDVRLDSGVEIEFNSDGRVVEIEAPDRGVLDADFIKEMVPGHLYAGLKEMKLDTAVSSIESKRDGYKVEFSGAEYEEAFFSPDGDLIALYYQ
ncbi:MAG: PepSY-like domain-containing protein [Muribaculaceae bacterium]|nr:PepSY-like domain-containing protein [Muribaculaceae bacterium]